MLGTSYRQPARSRNMFAPPSKCAVHCASGLRAGGAVDRGERAKPGKIYCTLWIREAVMPNWGFWGNLGLARGLAAGLAGGSSPCAMQFASGTARDGEGGLEGGLDDSESEKSAV